MAKLTIIKYYPAWDENGLPQPGLTVIAYPKGTTSNGTNLQDQNNGRYKLVLDYEANGDGTLAYSYDIWKSGAKDLEAQDLGKLLEFYVDLVFGVGESPKTVEFKDINHQYGNALPTTIPFPKITIMHSTEDLEFFISDIQTTQFTIEVGTAGGGALPTTIRLKIAVGGA